MIDFLPSSMSNAFLSLLLITAGTIACTIPPVSEEEVVGTYVAQDLENTIDTVFLENNGVYRRRVYTAEGHLALNTQGRWDLEAGGGLILDNFFLNLDRDLTRFPELTLDGMQINTPFERSSGVWKFCAGDYVGEGCYHHLGE